MFVVALGADVLFTAVLTVAVLGASCGVFAVFGALVPAVPGEEVVVWLVVLVLVAAVARSGRSVRAGVLAGASASGAGVCACVLGHATPLAVVFVPAGALAAAVLAAEVVLDVPSTVAGAVADRSTSDATVGAVPAEVAGVGATVAACATGCAAAVVAVLLAAVTQKAAPPINNRPAARP